MAFVYTGLECISLDSNPTNMCIMLTIVGVGDVVLIS